MIPASALLRQAARLSQTQELKVDIVRGGQVILPDVDVIGGKQSSDRGSKIRTTADIELAVPNPKDMFKIRETTDRFRVKRGFKSLGITEVIQHGEFRIDEITYSDEGVLELSGSSLEAYIIDARFLRPRTPPYGQSTVGQISYLIKEVLPRAKVLAECTRNKPVQAKAPWDRERWDAIDALATSIDAEVYCDYRGYFVIRDIPSISRGRPVETLQTGPGGVLMERQTSSTRDRVYNAVSVSGESSDPKIPPVWDWAYDSNPKSPTFYYGDFGQVPRFYSSKFFRTKAQCKKAAQSMLDEALAKNQPYGGSFAGLVFLEAGDIVMAENIDGTLQRRMLQEVGMNYGSDLKVDFETLLMKDLTDEEA